MSPGFVKLLLGSSLLQHIAAVVAVARPVRIRQGLQFPAKHRNGSRHCRGYALCRRRPEIRHKLIVRRHIRDLRRLPRACDN